MDTYSQILIDLAEILMSDEELTCETALEDLPGWDSMGKLSLLSYLDEKHDRKLKLGMLDDLVIIRDIINIIKKS